MLSGYNAEGLRAWESDPSHGTLYFVYDGSAAVAEVDAGGRVLAADTFGADGLAARYSGGTERFYAFDPQGSVAELIGADGSVLGSFAFDAYGSRASTASTADPYSGFGGQWGYYDAAATSLTLCGHRYYDAATGRWVTRDPISYAGGMDLYGYVADDPTDGADPQGLCASDPDYLRNQMLLGGLGMIPGLGEVANGASALYALSNGDYAGAAFAAAALIPIAGEAADAANEARLAEKVAGAAEGEAKPVAQIATGTAKEEIPVIIGESMNRVNAYAEKVGGEVYSPADMGGDRALELQANEAWIRDLMSSGRKIIDIGHDPQRMLTPSPFYNLEKDVSADYGRLTFDPQR